MTIISPLPLHNAKKQTFFFYLYHSVTQGLTPSPLFHYVIYERPLREHSWINWGPCLSYFIKHILQIWPIFLWLIDFYFIVKELVLHYRNIIWNFMLFSPLHQFVYSLFHINRSFWHLFCRSQKIGRTICIWSIISEYTKACYKCSVSLR